MILIERKTKWNVSKIKSKIKLLIKLNYSMFNENTRREFLKGDIDNNLDDITLIHPQRSSQNIEQSAQLSDKLIPDLGNFFH